MGDDRLPSLGDVAASLEGEPVGMEGPPSWLLPVVAGVVVLCLAAVALLLLLTVSEFLNMARVAPEDF